MVEALQSLTPLCAAWLGFLGRQLAYSLAVAAAVLIVLRLGRVRSPALRSAAWSLVLLRLVIPPGWGTRFSLRALADSALGASSVDPVADAMGAIASPAAGSAAAQMASMGTPEPVLWPCLLCLAWAAGAGFLAWAVLVRVRHYRRVVRRARPVTDRVLCGQLDRWRGVLGVRRPVRVVTSDAVLSPFTSGLWRPVIFLPEAMLSWRPRALEPVLAHEVCHVRRLDELRILAVCLVRALNFFNPAVWLAAAQLARAREELCDQRVLDYGSISRRVYGRSLVDVLRLNVCGTTAADAAVGLIDGKDGVQMRLASILSGQPPRRLRLLWVALATLVVGVVVLPMAPVAGDAGNPQVVAELEDGEIFKYVPSERMTPPTLLERVQPQYPEEARAARLQGVVVLEAVVTAAGEVGEVKALRKMPKGLTEAAIEAVKQWRFEPALLDGEPVAVTYVLTVNFALQEDKQQAVDPQAIRALLDELPSGVAVSQVSVLDGELGLSGHTGDGDAVAEYLSRLDASGQCRETVLESMTRSDDGFQFHVACRLAD
jgi:TonB family protein